MAPPRNSKNFTSDIVRYTTTKSNSYKTYIEDATLDHRIERHPLPANERNAFVLLMPSKREPPTSSHERSARPTGDAASTAPDRTLHRINPGLFIYVRCILSGVFFASALYKLAYMDLASLTAAYSIEDASIPPEMLYHKPPVEFWPGIPCVRRFDDALEHYVLLPPTAIARLRPWYPIAFLTAAVFELLGATLFVLGRWQGARLLLVVLGVVTLVMHPVWDATARFDALRNMSLAGGLLLCEALMRGTAKSNA